MVVRGDDRGCEASGAAHKYPGVGDEEGGRRRRRQQGHWRRIPRGHRKDGKRGGQISRATGTGSSTCRFKGRRKCPWFLEAGDHHNV